MLCVYVFFFISNFFRFSRYSKQDITSASGLIQSILKEDVSKLREDEQCRVCSILCTAEYCLETSQQLQDKLKEKVDPPLRQKIDLTQQQDIFHK